MEGYEVYSLNDDKTIGHVVAVVGEHLIVEHGTLRKSRNALPLAFAEIDEVAQRITTTLSEELVHESPKADSDGAVDSAAVADHYGLASAFEEPPARGYGELDADELGEGTEADARRAGREPADAERARIRESMSPETERPVEDNPALLGDRYRDVPPPRDER